MTHLLQIVAALWWGLALAILAASFLAALFHVPGRYAHGDISRPVSAIVPIKYWNAQLEDDLASLFSQDYAQFEVLLTAQEDNSLAMDAVRQVQARFPAVPSRILRSDVALAASPKLNNLWNAIGGAAHDLILTIDSNVRLAPGDLEHLVRHHESGVGLVSTISITAAPQSLGAWIETSIVNCYHGRMLMLASVLGQGVGCGKIMMFRRDDLDRAGGLPGLAWAIGEDEAMQQAFARIGLRTVLSDRTSGQVLGRRTLREVWQRQLRWVLIWRLQTPAVFVGDFLASALPASLAAALAAPLFDMAPWAATVETLALWCVLEMLLCRIKGWPLSAWAPFHLIGRECLVMAARLRALTTRDVIWGGVRRRVARRHGLAA